MTDEPEKNGRNPVTGRWLPGNNGNPNGKPPGTRVKALRHLDMLFENEGDRLSRKCIEEALKGDMVAMRLALERVHPPRKGRVVHVDLPPIETAADVGQAIGIVTQTVAAGELTPDEGAAMAGLLEARRRAIETVELALRIKALEEAQNR